MKQSILARCIDASGVARFGQRGFICLCPCLSVYGSVSASVLCLITRVGAHFAGTCNPQLQHRLVLTLAVQMEAGSQPVVEQLFGICTMLKLKCEESGEETQVSKRKHSLGVCPPSQPDPRLGVQKAKHALWGFCQLFKYVQE